MTTNNIPRRILPLILYLIFSLALIAGCGQYIPGEHDIIDMTKPVEAPYCMLTHTVYYKKGDIDVDAERKSIGSLSFIAKSRSGSDITVTLSQYPSPNMGDTGAYTFVNIDVVTETPSGVQADISLYRLFGDDDPIYLYFYIDNQNYVCLLLSCYSTIKDPFIGYVSEDTEELITEIEFSKELNQISYPRTNNAGGADMLGFYYDYLTWSEAYSADVTYEIDDNTAQLFGIDKDEFTFTADGMRMQNFGELVVDRLKDCGATDVDNKLFSAIFRVTLTYTGKLSGIVQTFDTEFTFVRGQQSESMELYAIGGTVFTQSGQNIAFSAVDETGYIVYSNAGLGTARITANFDITDDWPLPPFSVVAPLFSDYVPGTAINPKDCFEKIIPAEYRSYLPFLEVAQEYYNDEIPLCTITFNESDVSFGILYDVSDLIAVISDTATNA